MDVCVLSITVVVRRLRQGECQWWREDRSLWCRRLVVWVRSVLGLFVVTEMQYVTYVQLYVNIVLGAGIESSFSQEWISNQ